MLVALNLFLVTRFLQRSIDGVSGVSSARTTTILFTNPTESSSVLRLIKIDLAPRAYPNHHSARFALLVLWFLASEAMVGLPVVLSVKYDGWTLICVMIKLCKIKQFKRAV